MTFSVVNDLASTLEKLLDHTPVERIVVVEIHPDFPTELVFQTFGTPEVFHSQYQDWLSPYLMLNDIYNFPAFVDRLIEDDWKVVFAPSTEPILASAVAHREPLVVDGHDLYPFQQYGLRRAMESDFWFFNWSPGAGKTHSCVAGVKELFNRGDIDLVIATTPAPLKIGLSRFFERAGLDATLAEGTKAKRSKIYAENYQVYVINYERFRLDEPELTELVKDKRVLFILDEVSKLLTGEANSPNKARKAFDRLVGLAPAGVKVWAMSATVVNGDPLKYRDVFNLHPNRSNPLGTKASFKKRYTRSITTVPLRTRTGKQFTLTNYDWNLVKLTEVRHRVAPWTQIVRKSDPGMGQNFKGLSTVEIPIVASGQDRKLLEVITEEARGARHRGESLAPYYRLLRTACTAPEGVAHTSDEIGRHIAAEYPELVTCEHSTKLAVLNEMLGEIREAGDKVVVFCHWTTLGLHVIKSHIGVPYVIHHGGQSLGQRQDAVDRFFSDPNITLFLTSDAGSHGLNIQCARSVIQLDPLYSYDDFIQRASRIDRTDSHLDGLTNFMLLTEDSVEERVWNICEQRRALSAAVQGSAESLEVIRARRSETQNLDYLVFG